jgi:hypothetical protein
MNLKPWYIQTKFVTKKILVKKWRSNAINDIHVVMEVQGELYFYYNYASTSHSPSPTLLLLKIKDSNAFIIQ